ncbi:Eukaryotic translation initiation factor 3 subunit F [Spathaspora sp. JA1]|nr:Eukaryotic translation initiation factor 3 subunit F [Spathaspora sp. JA1]
MSSDSFMHLVRPGVSAPAAASVAHGAQVKIHTPAMLSILEIVSKQVISTNKRVIGSLLGSRSEDGSIFEIMDAFVVPCNETGDSIVIEDQTHKTLYQLYKKGHPKQTVLGWFGSSNVIDNTTSLIHDFYSKGSDRAYPFPAIHLNVEYLNEENQIIAPKITTYIGAAVGKPTTTAQIGWNTNVATNSYIFTPIPNQLINGTTSEKIAFKNLQQNVITNNTNNLHQDLSYLSQQLDQVDGNVEQLINYIDSKAGQSDNDVDLLRLLSNTLLNKPQLLNNLEELQRLFRDHNQDVIMIEYLTKAVKDQIELSARLTAASGESDKKYQDN